MDAFSFLELFVPIFAILGNLLALDGVWMGDIPLAGFRRFLISLLASDLYICVVKLLLVIVEKMAHSYFELNMQVHKCFGELGRSLEIAGFIAYLLNLCGMFVDHYIALLHAHQYKYLMEKRIARVAVFLIWPAAFIIGFIDHPVRAFIHWIMRRRDGPGVLLSVGMDVIPNCTELGNMGSFSTYTPNIAQDYNTPDYETVTPEEMFDPFSPSMTDELPTPCRSDDFNATLAVLDAVRRGLDFDGNNYRKSLILCASFDRTSKLWLDWIVVILAVAAAAFLAVCYFFFRKAVERAGRAKGKLQKLTITTFLLLGAFIVCWMPYICYELFMELIFQTNQTILTATSSQTFYVVHNFLHLLFICSPLLVPIIYVTRLRVVQRQIIKRYGMLIPAFLRQHLITRALHVRSSSFAETSVLAGTLSLAEATTSTTAGRPENGSRTSNTNLQPCQVVEECEEQCDEQSEENRPLNSEVIVPPDDTVRSAYGGAENGDANNHLKDSPGSLWLVPKSKSAVM